MMVFLDEASGLEGVMEGLRSGLTNFLSFSCDLEELTDLCLD